MLVSFELKNKNFGRVKSLIICRKRSCRYHAAPPEKIKYFQCLNCKNIFILLAIHQLLFKIFKNRCMLMSIEMINTENNKLYQNINTLLTKYTKLKVFSLVILRRSFVDVFMLDSNISWGGNQDYRIRICCTSWWCRWYL